MDPIRSGYGTVMRKVREDLISFSPGDKATCVKVDVEAQSSFLGETDLANISLPFWSKMRILSSGSER